jgi:hypothetical protein
VAAVESRLAPYRRAEYILVRAGFSLSEIRLADQGEVESWLRVIREAAPPAPTRPGGKPPPVKKLSKRFLEQQKGKK